MQTFLTTLALTLALPVTLSSSPSCRPLCAVWEVSQFSHSVEMYHENFPGLFPSLYVVATSGWPIRDRLTAVNPLQVMWPHDMPRPLSLSPAAPCTHSRPQARA
jgi:hypothetical protein